MQTVRLGYSPCPNDTFIFAALASGRLKPSPWSLEIRLADVETLNAFAREGRFEFTKISVHAFAQVSERYALLRSGAAMGRGCGPVVVAPRQCTMEDLRGQAIAVPGNLTTANLLLHLYGEEFQQTVPMRYDSIMERVKQGDFAAGVVIHEGRFTYQDYGLHAVLDLGGWWEKTQGLPLPLGVILVRRDLGQPAAAAMEEAIRRSLLLARRHPDEVWPYVKAHAQEMDDAVIGQHIDLYVNDYSLDLGGEGILAIRRLLDLACQHGLVPPVPAKLFLSE